MIHFCDKYLKVMEIECFRATVNSSTESQRDFTDEPSTDDDTSDLSGRKLAYQRAEHLLLQWADEYKMERCAGAPAFH